MTRHAPRLALTLAALTLAAAGCGSSDTPNIDADVASTAVEKAASISLEKTSVPEDARKQGLDAAYSNVATTTKDKQIVFLFTLKDSDTVGELSEQLRSSVPGEDVQLFTHANLVVVYGSVGTDRAAAVKSAVNAL